MTAQDIIGKLRDLNWWIVALLVLLGAFGSAMLYSVAGGKAEPWAAVQLVRFLVLIALMFAMAMVDLRVWYAIAYPVYGVVLLLLLAVELIGAVGGGAQRWIDLGVINLQPSELMKIALVMALARFFHQLPRVYVTNLPSLLIPLVMVLVPVALVLLQPNLGTATMLILASATVVFLAGASQWLFWAAGGTILLSLPVIWTLMHDYQRQRVLTFLDPGQDPLGSGYNITQSMIAIGSGGALGKGYLHGTQGALEFLPEHHTDFIFAAIAEEFGFAGGIILLACYGLLLAWISLVALNTRSTFGRLLAMGLAMSVFLYIGINLAMVMGLAPVVGIPLPLMSYGGSAMMTVLMAMGLVFSISLNRDDPLLRHDQRGPTL
jgi:rod shape determining protein RodA